MTYQNTKSVKVFHDLLPFKKIAMIINKLLVVMMQSSTNWQSFSSRNLVDRQWNNA